MMDSSKLDAAINRADSLEKRIDALCCANKARMDGTLGLTIPFTASKHERGYHGVFVKTKKGKKES